jgi:hypothetical protein
MLFGLLFLCECPRLAPKDVAFIRDVVPGRLESFPRLKLPASVRHPAGFAVSGASVGTFLRSALLVAGQKALGRRFGGHEFYDRIERDLAFGIMRSHFHHGYPKGVHCCVQCTLAVIPVLDAGAIRYFDCPVLPGASSANANGGSPDRPIREWCAGRWATSVPDRPARFTYLERLGDDA